MNHCKSHCTIVAKHAHQNQAINIEIVSNQHITSCTRLTRGKGKNPQRVNVQSADQKCLVVYSGEIFSEILITEFLMVEFHITKIPINMVLFPNR